VRLGSAALFCVLAAGPRARAADTAAPSGALEERYRNALDELERERANEDKTRAERDRLAAEAHDLEQKLVANAARVQQLQSDYAASTAERDRLSGVKTALEARFDKDRARVVHLLAVLQRLNADEPPALAIHPGDSLAAARGAMQLGATLPPIYAQAAALAKEVKRLSDATAAMKKKAAEAAAQASALSAARAQLDTLLAERNREASDAGARLSELHGITEEIGQEADDLKGLIARVASLRAVGATEGMTLVTAGRPTSAGLRRGSLRKPVMGAAIPGDPAGPGTTPGTDGPSGLWFETQGNTEAVAPADSEVVFAGPYQKFGQVLILEIAGGYHLTLAGLARIDVHIGDSLLAGEPVGVLPAGQTGRLYMELRRGGQTIDPGPWMGPELRKAKGS
jgi:septal ring factor EnvC (AmiA/AmiB activator)